MGFFSQMLGSLMTKRLKAAAEKGDAWAQVELGEKYRAGDGVAQDYAEALKWHKLAAAQGNVIARVHVEMMTARGQDRSIQ